MKFLQDLTLGHYYPIESAIHSLDPRVKLLGLFLIGITLFSLDRLWGLAVFFLAALWLIRCSHLPLATVIRGLRPFGWLFLLTACLQLFFTSGQPIFPVDLGPLETGGERWTVNGNSPSSRAERGTSRPHYTASFIHRSQPHVKANADTKPMTILRVYRTSSPAPRSR